jgi:RND family efflux transporter MFP subunit
LAVSLPLSGSLAPLSSATIKSKVSGVVEVTTVQEGMAVGAGQVLARIDQADLRARLQQQQAMLDEAQAKLAMASKNEGNSQALLQQKYISQNAYDATQNTVDLARANVKSAAAMVAIARIALEDGVIKAPISGVVSKRHVQAGEKLAPDMAVFSIVNLSELTLEAQVPASEIPRVKVGQDVKFKVDGYAQREFIGKVARINPATEMGSRAMLVYISVKNDDSALRAGMFAKGSIVTERSAVATILPMAALRSNNGQQVVYKIDQGKVVAQPVKLGLRNDDEGYAEVVEGLQQGAHVIVSRLDSLKPGAAVKLPPSAQAKNTEPAKG